MAFDVRLVGLEHGRAFNNNTLELQLMVTQDDYSTWNPWFNPVTVRTSAGIPTPGETLDDVSGFSWVTELGAVASWPDWSDSYRVREVKWSAVGGSLSTYRCRVYLTDRTLYCPGPHVRRSDATQIRQVDRFRDENPTTSTTDGADLISTTLKGSGLMPERFEVTQVAIQLLIPWRTDAGIGSYGWPNVSDLFGDKLRRVNSATFLGMPAGSVMFSHVEVDEKEDEYVELIASFVWDEWFHMTQEPQYFEGDKSQISLVDVGGVNVPKVKWRSMARGSVDFAAMFTADELEWAQEGWGAFYETCVTGVTPLMQGTYNLVKKNTLTVER